MKKQNNERTRTMNRIYRVYSDPGHGWMAVKRESLIYLGILHRISGFSYMKDQTVYLEEDCDATLFFKAFEAVFGEEPRQTCTSVNYPHNIRGYEQFIKADIPAYEEARSKHQDYFFKETL